MKRSKLCLLALVALLQGAPAATISTLPSPHDGFTDATWNHWVGQAFQITTAPATVVSVSLPIIITAPNANFVVRVVGSTSSNPNVPDMANVRATLYHSDAFVQNNAVQIIVFTLQPGQPVQVLDADTRYWLIMGATDPDFNEANSAGLAKWSYTNTNALPVGPSDAAALLNFVAESGTAGTGWTALPQSPQRFGLELTPVPEPGTACLLIFTMGLINRRNRC
jgi:hypothetical protein